MDEADGIQDKIRSLQARISSLEGTQRELERALEEIDHQGRRVADRIERAGGNDREAEAEQRQLADRRKANQRDHLGNSRELDRLRAEAAELQRRIDELRRG